MKKNIITPEEAKTLGRPLGKHISDAKIQAYIEEVEMTIVRPTLGDGLYLKLTEMEEELNDELRILVEGGKWKDNCGNDRYLVGLKRAVAYYVYAQNVMSGDFESTRYGMVVKNGEYSDNITSRERSDIYNSATSIADSYMKECKAYIGACKCLQTGANVLHSTSGCIIHKIN